MINRKIGYKKECEINIIPFLDVLLVLLLIFMISTPIITQNFEVDLPNSSYSKKSINKNDMLEIIIEVLGNDCYNMSINHKKIKNISSNQMLSEIQLKKNIKLHDMVFFVAAPYDISYNEVIKTLNFLYKIGISSVNILTKPT